MFRLNSLHSISCFFFRLSLKMTQDRNMTIENSENQKMRREEIAEQRDRERKAEVSFLSSKKIRASDSPRNSDTKTLSHHWTGKNDRISAPAQPPPYKRLADDCSLIKTAHHHGLRNPRRPLPFPRLSGLGP